jgi:hypothetical protein
LTALAAMVINFMAGSNESDFGQSEFWLARFFITQIFGESDFLRSWILVSRINDQSNFRTNGILVTT